jgi:hypothetical protein
MPYDARATCACVISHAVWVEVRALAAIVSSDHFGNALCERIGMSFNDPPPGPSV